MQSQHQGGSKQVDCEFKASLGYIVRSCRKAKRSKTKQKETKQKQAMCYYVLGR
jgi:hypothetical protein